MSQLITMEEALGRIRERASVSTDTQSAPIECAVGRRIADDLRADGPWPVTDRSAMDGFACATGGAGIAPNSVWPVVGAALAGHPFDAALETGQAVRIMTGGVVPEGADTVVKVEDTSGFEGEKVTVTIAVAAGSNIRARGSEIEAGTVLVPRGARIRWAEIGALAVLGRSNVQVVRRPCVGVLATGDEVVPIDREPLPHQVRDSNAWSLAAQVEEVGGEAVRLGIAG
ncbi:MAG: molybdopterin molybdotransferase MoeA, partial [Planctomycetes bacterium]|nr:molybdopterin molybdotransferase MoeA [Planctomycetota bacterium]